MIYKAKLLKDIVCETLNQGVLIKLTFLHLSSYIFLNRKYVNNVFELSRKMCLHT